MPLGELFGTSIAPLLPSPSLIAEQWNRLSVPIERERERELTKDPRMRMTWMSLSSSAYFPGHSSAALVSGELLCSVSGPIDACAASGHCVACPALPIVGVCCPPPSDHRRSNRASACLVPRFNSWSVYVGTGTVALISRWSHQLMVDHAKICKQFISFLIATLTWSTDSEREGEREAGVCQQCSSSSSCAV